MLLVALKNGNRSKKMSKEELKKMQDVLDSLLKSYYELLYENLKLRDQLERDKK